MSFRGRFKPQTGYQFPPLHQLGLELCLDCECVICYSPSFAVFRLFFELEYPPSELDVFREHACAVVLEFSDLEGP